ncbi:hypothetical protein BDN67DRAFT_976734 [Paxillus ammoniavirescens]|nr:hypothetical protein BDN67DRAFT_976734 [Paxillus ammoniavirescens]
MISQQPSSHCSRKLAKTRRSSCCLSTLSSLAYPPEQSHGPSNRARGEVTYKEQQEVEQRRAKAGLRGQTRRVR